MENNTNPVSLSGKKFECHIVNSYGHGHNHEFDQYRDFSESLERIAAEKGFGGCLLGNIFCGNASLDTLLLTNFGVSIIEFKDYSSVAQVRITRQMAFQCLDANGNQIMGEDGSFLTVKGGSLDSPFEQARKNRLAVRNVLKQAFGDEAKGVSVRLAIVFNGATSIEGIDKLGEDSKWLSVLNSAKFNDFITYAAGEKTLGLNADQRQSLISYLDANKGVGEPTSHFDKALNFYSLEKYDDAYKCLLRCDPLNPNVVSWKLHALAKKQNDQRAFNQLLSEHLGSGVPAVRRAVNICLADAYDKGVNGYRKNEEKALKHYIKSESKEEWVSVRILELQTRIEARKAEAARKDTERERKARYDSKKKETISESADGYSFSGRIVYSLLAIMSTLLAVATLLPHHPGNAWHKLAIFIAFLIAVVIFAWLKDSDDPETRYIWKKALPHSESMSFRIIHMGSHSYKVTADRLYKTILHSAIVAAYYGLVLFLFLRMGSILLKMKYVNDFIRFMSTTTGMDVLAWISILGLIYVMLVTCSMAYNIYRNIIDADLFWNGANDGRKDVYLVAVPDIWDDIKSGWNSSACLMIREGVAFAVGLTVTMSVLSAARPLLYRLGGILF